MKRTMVVWRRLGKEHGEESGFKLNPPEVIAAHIRDKVTAFRQTPVHDWRWWQVSEAVIVEKPPGKLGSGPNTAIYYLPRRNWVIVEDTDAARLGKWWTWYVHIGDIAYDPNDEIWIFTDLFCDVVIKEDKKTHIVLDLDELGRAFEMGLITGTQMTRTLADTQNLIDLVRSGGFPPMELRGLQNLPFE